MVQRALDRGVEANLSDIDPYRLLIECERDDNVRKVRVESSTLQAATRS